MKRYVLFAIAMVFLAFFAFGCQKQPEPLSTQTTQTEIQPQTEMPEQTEVPEQTYWQGQEINLLDALGEVFDFDVIFQEISWYDGTNCYDFDSRNEEFCASFLNYLNTTTVIPVSRSVWDGNAKALHITFVNLDYDYLTISINEKGQLKRSVVNDACFQGDGIYEAFIRCISPYVEKNAKYVQAVYGENYSKDYVIWNAKGEVIYEGNNFREERLVLVNDKIVHRWGQAGTGLLTRWAVFYDVKNNRISPNYYGQTDSCGELALSVASKAVVVFDMFNGEELYRFDTFEYPLLDAIESIVFAYFINDGKQILVSYRDENGEERRQTFDLPEKLSAYTQR